MKNSLVIFILLAFIGCSKVPEAKKKEDIAPIVDVADLKRELIVDSVKLVGDLKAIDEITLYSKVPGKLIKYLAKEGDRVGEDESVALVDRDEVGFKFQDSPVTTPIAGVVAKTFLDHGSDVRLDTPVALIVNLDEMRAHVNIGEKFLPAINVGQKVYIKSDAYPEESFQGVVKRIIPFIDKKTRTIPVEVSIKNSYHKLVPGMFVRVELILKEFEDSLVVPEEAVVVSDDGTFVFIVESGIAKRVSVKLGIRKPGVAQVLSGLSGDEEIIVSGHQKVQDNMRVVKR